MSPEKDSINNKKIDCKMLTLKNLLFDYRNPPKAKDVVNYLSNKDINSKPLRILSFTLYYVLTWITRYFKNIWSQNYLMQSERKTLRLKSYSYSRMVRKQ